MRAAREQREGAAGLSQEEYAAFQAATFEKDIQLLREVRGLKVSKAPPPTSAHLPSLMRQIPAKSGLKWLT